MLIRRFGRATSEPGMEDSRREQWSRVMKKETSVLKEKWEKWFQWKATGQCSTGDPCSFNHRSYSGQRAQSSSSSSKPPTQTDGRKPCRNGSPKGVLQDWKAENRVKKILKGKCTDPSCDPWHPPVCLNYKSESGCKYGDRLSFQTHWWWRAAQ